MPVSPSSSGVFLFPADYNDCRDAAEDDRAADYDYPEIVAGEREAGKIAYARDLAFKIIKNRSVTVLIRFRDLYFKVVMAAVKRAVAKPLRHGTLE